MWRELSGRELMTNQTASRTATRSYSPSSVEIGCHKTVSLRNNDRWRTSSRSGPEGEGGSCFSPPASFVTDALYSGPTSASLQRRRL